MVERFILIAALATLLPVAAAAQAPARHALSVQGTVGPLVNFDSAVSGSISFGYSPSDRFTFLVAGERHHIPSKVTRDEHGWSAFRGGNLTFASAEAQIALLAHRRVIPYALVGAGRGISRANVNATFPDETTTRPTGAVFIGGGVRVPLRDRLTAVVDTRFIVAAEWDTVALLAPIRAGIAWRF